MNLSTIERKLVAGQYKETWEYVDDVWRMFDNAWVYNRKSSKVNDYRTKLSEVFEAEISSVMQSLGYCCGVRQFFTQQKCYSNLQGDEIELIDDPSQPSVFVDCDECGRKLHKICVLHFEPIWNDGFTCENCLEAKGAKRKENKYTAS
ncbi:CBP-like protein, partial [Mya arenaria]